MTEKPFIKYLLILILILIFLPSALSLIGKVINFVSYEKNTRNIIALQKNFINQGPEKKSEAIKSYNNLYIGEWVEKATTSTMTFSFDSYKEKLQENSAYFTQKGWKSFSEALQKSRTIDYLVQDHLVLKTSIGDFSQTSVKLIKNESAVKEWEIMIPLKLEYSSPQGKKIQNLLTTITAKQSSEIQNDGLGIEQWIALPHDE